MAWRCPSVRPYVNNLQDIFMIFYRNVYFSRSRNASHIIMIVPPFLVSELCPFKIVKKYIVRSIIVHTLANSECPAESAFSSGSAPFAKSKSIFRDNRSPNQGG